VGDCVGQEVLHDGKMPLKYCVRVLHGPVKLTTEKIGKKISSKKEGKKKTLFVRGNESVTSSIRGDLIVHAIHVVCVQYIVLKRVKSKYAFPPFCI
jgi:hypothetical protein